jgi:N-acetylneuraminic acid mutarotase
LSGATLERVNVAVSSSTLVATLFALAACSGGSSPTRGTAAGTGGALNSAGTAATDAGKGGTMNAGSGGSGMTTGFGGAQSAGTSGASGGADRGSGGSSGSMPRAGAGGSTAGVAGSAAGGRLAAGSGGDTSNAGTGNPGGSGSELSGTPTEEALPDLADVRQEHSVVALGGLVYIIGGYVAQKNSASVLVYDPEQKTYASVADFPGPINHGNAGAVNGKLYVAGCYVGSDMQTATTENYAYDPGTDEWTAAAPLPAGTERGAACVAVDGNVMYVIGGARDGKSVDSVARYDATADHWTQLAKLPERREHCAAGAMFGKIYVGGGRVDGITTVEPKTWEYDPATDTWTQKADIEPARGGLAGAVLQNRLLVFGGEGNPAAMSNGVYPDIDAYDPVTNTWARIGTMAVPRHGYGAGLVGDRIYLMGGAIKQGGTPGNKSSVFYFE